MNNSTFFGNVDNQMRPGPIKTCHQLAGYASHLKLDPGTVAKGLRRGDYRHYPLTLHASGAPEKLGKYLLFRGELIGVRQVLPVASPALAENRALGNYPPD